MLIIKSEFRLKKGTAETRRLRNKNKCPAIIYKDLAISLNQNDLKNPSVLSNFYKNNVIKLILNNNTTLIVKIKDIHYHPFKSEIIHVDFIKI